jgi:hypothetical protein
VKSNNRKGPAKRKAPRREGTGRESKLYLLEKVIIHARLVKPLGACRAIGEILPALLEEVERGLR